MSAYYLPNAGFTYGTPVSWLRLLHLLPEVRGRQILHVLSLWDLAFWTSILGWVALLSGNVSPVRRWIALVLPVALLFPVNLLGALAIPHDFVPLSAFDGEVLGEHWPVIHVYGLWTISSVVVTAMQLRLARKTRLEVR